MSVIDAANARWGVALLFAVEPSDRALAGWGPCAGPAGKGHPRSWARWMLRWLAQVEA